MAALEPVTVSLDPVARHNCHLDRLPVVADQQHHRRQDGIYLPVFQPFQRASNARNKSHLVHLDTPGTGCRRPDLLRCCVFLFPYCADHIGFTDAVLFRFAWCGLCCGFL